MTKWVCSVCGYVYEGEKAPEACPVCKAPADKFVKQDGEMSWAAEHVVGVAQGSSEDIMADLRANFQGECSEVGMYLAMARVAHREGYPEIGLYYEKAAYEEAEHAAKFAELLGEVRKQMRTVLQLVKQTLLNVQKLLTLTLSMIQFMKWQEMKQDTEKHSQVFLRDISENNSIGKSHKINLLKGEPQWFSLSDCRQTWCWGLCPAPFFF